MTHTRTTMQIVPRTQATAARIICLIDRKIDDRYQEDTMRAGMKFIVYGYAWDAPPGVRCPQSAGKLRACEHHRVGTGDSTGSRSVQIVYLREPSWPATRDGMAAADKWCVHMNRTEGNRVRAPQNE